MECMEQEKGSCLELNSPEIWEKNGAVDEKVGVKIKQAQGKGWEGRRIKSRKKRCVHCDSWSAIHCSRDKDSSLFCENKYFAVVYHFIIHASLRYITDHSLIHLLLISAPQRLSSLVRATLVKHNVLSIHAPLSLHSDPSISFTPTLPFSSHLFPY